jgi:hypothetical protein
MSIDSTSTPLKRVILSIVDFDLKKSVIVDWGKSAPYMSLRENAPRKKTERKDFAYIREKCIILQCAFRVRVIRMNWLNTV